MPLESCERRVGVAIGGLAQHLKVVIDVLAEMLFLFTGEVPVVVRAVVPFAEHPLRRDQSISSAQVYEETIHDAV